MLLLFRLEQLLGANRINCPCLSWRLQTSVSKANLKEVQTYKGWKRDKIVEGVDLKRG